MINRYLLTLSILFLGGYRHSIAVGSETLSIDTVISLTLAHNYDILMSRNQVKQSENNASILNTETLPSLSLSAGGSVQQIHNEVESSEGTVTTNDNTVRPISANADVTYILFNGYRIHNIRKLKSLYDVSKLELRQLIENIIVEIYDAYYELFFLQQQLDNQIRKKNVSKGLLHETRIALSYGSTDELPFLNAQIDFNNDSIAVVDAQNQLANAKRNLNLLMGLDITKQFSVNSEFDFKAIPNIELLLEDAKTNNIDLLLADQQLDVLSHEQKRLKASLILPTLSLQGSYGYSGNNFIAAIGSTQESTTLTGSLTLSYNIFSGGSVRNQWRNAKIDIKNQEIAKEKTVSTLENNLRNIYENYKNQQKIVEIEKLNIRKNEKSFSRSLNQFKSGQITRVEYRTSLLNLFNAKQTLTYSMYKLKTLEIQLIKLSMGLVSLQ